MSAVIGTGWTGLEMAYGRTPGYRFSFVQATSREAMNQHSMRSDG
jgi:hypothetical protein